VTNPEWADISWRKSSFSESSGCVEVGRTTELVALRDTYARSGPVLTFAPGEWSTFLDDVLRGAALSRGRTENTY
jgi:hypothetical protein